MVRDAADTDAALVSRCRELDDRRAFDEIVARYMDRVINYVRRMIPDRDEADDVAQEVFVRVYAGLRSFQRRATLHTWLFRIATNLCIDYRRRHLRPERRPVPLDAVHHEARLSGSVDTEAPEHAAMQSELGGMIEQAIAELPFRLRAVVVLHDVEGLPYDEIARIVGCPLGTVKSRLFHARSALRERLGPYLRGDEAGDNDANGPGR